MVIIIIVVTTIVAGIVAMIIQTNATQTIRMSEYMKAKYVATSGTQLTLGAYFEKGASSPLYQEFSNRAQSNGKARETPITAEHQFKNGTAKITMTGGFEPTGSVNPSDYEVKIVSEAPLSNGNGTYVHTVTFNWETSGIRDESGGLR